nr:hypothetical protein [Solirubrobacterales bacterium]
AANGSGGEIVNCGPGKDTVRADATDKVSRNCERVFRLELRLTKTGKKNRG